MSSYAKKVSEFIPITLRGLVLVLFLLFLYLQFVKESSDIIATVIVVTLFLVLFTLLASALFWGFYLRQRTILSLYPGSVKAITARVPVTLSVRLNPVRIPPLFTLIAEPFFCDQKAPLMSALFSGFAKKNRSTTAPVAFPHRGYWHTERVRWLLTDCFGLTAFYWENEPLNKSQSITVEPPEILDTGLPLIASSYREGDTIPHHTDFSGDYYDIKRYHPSDGMNKLLWKLFARSGELLARKPEESVAPEGQIVAFCLAHRTDDALAAAFLRYVSIAEAAEMRIIAGCTGSASDTPARSSEKAYEMILAAAHHIPQTLDPDKAGNNISDFVDTAKNILQISKLAHVILFVSDSFISTPAGTEALLQIGKHVADAGAQPVFCYIPTTDSSTTTQPTRRLPASLQTFLNVCVEHATESPRSQSFFPQFMNACRPYGWAVHIGARA
jgi:uncharacterized protein (DUF58 family)